MSDITFRAIDVLKSVDLILAEDTRVSKKLLQHYDIPTRISSFHAHNEHKIYGRIIDRLKEGENLALISDAGTPAISDPGFLLVRACVENDIIIESLPGASALLTAVTASGLPCDRFHFEGFLPHKKGRKTRLEYLASLPNTFVLYESPFRVHKCIRELAEHCGSERPACVARELTKKFEEYERGTLSELMITFPEEKKLKGEFVIVVGGKV